MVVAVLTVAGIAVVAVLAGVELPSPFSTTEVAHAHAVTVEQLQDVSTYTAASQHLTVGHRHRGEGRPPPASLKGERVVFVAEGDVEATVDFSQLTDSGIETSADGTEVTVHLPEPAARRAPPRPEQELGRRPRPRACSTGPRTRSRARGSGDQKYYEKAEQELAETADRTELRDRAEANTRTFVQGLFTAAGYDTVTVVFDQPAGGAAA